MIDERTKKKASLKKETPTSYRALVNRAEAYLAIGCADEALADFDAAIEQKSTDLQVHMNRFQVLLRLDKLDRLLDAATSIQAIAPKESIGDFYRGMALSHLSRELESVEAYTRAIEKTPRQPAAYVNRAAAYSSLGLMKNCLADCDKALSLNKKMVSAYINKAVALRCLGEPDQAIKVCDQAIKIEADSPLAYCNRAMAKFALNRVEEAFTDIDTSIRFSKEAKYAAKCRAIKAKFLAILGSGGGGNGGNDGRRYITEARELCDSAIRMASENSYPWRYTWSTSALISAMTGDFEAANRNVQLVLDRCESFTYGINIKSRILLMQDRLDDALMTVDSALARNDRDPESNYIRYIIRVRQNDSNASEDLNRARAFGYLLEK